MTRDQATRDNRRRPMDRLNPTSAALVALVAATLVVAVGSISTPTAQTSRVAVVRLPVGGIQPQVAVDRAGVAHVVYFTGEPANGDLFYTSLNEAGEFSVPVRVNSPGSAIATGTVRGAQVAIGRNGTIHVIWNGSSKATPKGPNNTTPMLYSRLQPGRRVFEPQRNLLQFATGLDGGGAITADERGRVIVAWHAGGPESKGEGDRRVWMATSSNDGSTFSTEVAVSEASTGACGCCGMDGLIDQSGAIFFLYRSARDVVHRDAYLLKSTNGRQFSSAKLQEWNIGACPMSTFSLAEGPQGVLAAWETNGQVQFMRVSGTTQAAGPIEAPGSTGRRRHPALAVNARGDILLAWSEGTAWQKGGGVAWQVYGKDGRPLAERGQSSGVPIWGLTATYARRDGGFMILY